MTSRRSFLAAPLAALPALSSQGRKRPNLLLLLSDQQHWQALGIQDRFYDTPNQDRLAGESAVFDHAFCSTPQCSPSRSSIFTGFYPSRTQVYGNIGALGGNDLKMTTLGARLREAGYATGYFGKWHLGEDAQANAGWSEEWKKIDDAEVTRRGLDFLSKRKGSDQPFALVLSYHNPHDVYHFRAGTDKASAAGSPLSKSWRMEKFENKPAVQKQFMTDDQGKIIWGKEQGVWEAYREYYKQRVRDYDGHVGTMLQALDRQALAGGTIVVSSSDHGDMDTNHKLIFKGPFMYEHMVRIPLIIRVPAAFGGRGAARIGDIDTVNVDLAPTLADFAGLAPQESDGMSLRGALTGGGRKSRDFVIGEYYGKQKWVNPMRMLRTRSHKYNITIGSGEELYDLRNDPEELANLANDAGYAKVKRELKAELERWIQKRKDPFHSFTTTPLGRG